MAGFSFESTDPQTEASPYLGRQFDPQRLLNEAQDAAGYASNGNSTGGMSTDRSIAFKQGAAEVTSSVGAGVTGAVVYSLAMASTRGMGKALTIPLSMAFGAVSKYGLKSGVEHALLDKEHHTTSRADLAWGAVDALAGVAGSIVEQKASKMYLSHLGRKALGTSISKETAIDGARLLVKHSAAEAVKHNGIRGIAGGAAGTFTWSVPHRTHENWSEIQADPLKGLASTALETGQDTALGSLFGGILTGGGTALFRSRELAGQAAARVRGNANVLTTHHRFMGDFHSNLDQLPHMKTRLEALEAQSAAKGIATSFDITGDTLSGHVNFAFTKGGKTEYETLIDMGARRFIMGNHEHDAAGGLVDIPRWAKMIRPILQKNPQVSVLNANLDFSAYPEYKGLFRPYVIDEVASPWGTTKIAKIGLTTRDGAFGNIRYDDVEKVAIDTVRELNKKGVKHVILETHIGLGEDIKLAEALIRNDVKVAGILGGHTHSVTPAPIWVGPKRTLLDRLTGRATEGGNFEIPIMHAGPGGRWLGDFRPAMRLDGTADRYLTTGKLHPITSDIPADPKVARVLEAALPERNALVKTEYQATAKHNYSNRNVRNRETALGNLVSDAIRNGLKGDLGEDIVVMTHSGGIRSQIVSGKPITRLDLANLVMNAGDPAAETKELVFLRLPGRKIKEGLEYGVREVPVPEKPGMFRRIANLFGAEMERKAHDEPGNFVQVSGLKYSIDLTGEPWASGRSGSRVVDVKVLNGAGLYEALDPNKVYSVVTRQHPVHKWWSAGMFGDATFDQVKKDLALRPVEVSQVDLIGQHIRGKEINPFAFSAVEGRITNITPTVRQLPLRPGRSILAFPLVDAQNNV